MERKSEKQWKGEEREGRKRRSEEQKGEERGIVKTRLLSGKKFWIEYKEDRRGGKEEEEEERKRTEKGLEKDMN